MRDRHAAALWAVLAAVALGTPSAHASAQEIRAPEPAPSQRVLVTTVGPVAGPARVTGEFQEWRDSTLVLRAEGGVPRTIPLRTIEVLEVSRGRAPGPTLAGLLLGTAVGFALGCAANRDDYGVYCGGQSDATVFTGAALGGRVARPVRSSSGGSSGPRWPFRPRADAGSAGRDNLRGGRMPYIEAEARERVDAGGAPESAGELNYAITRLVDAYLVARGGLRYAHLNEVVGALECAKLELYRRLAGPYEDAKRRETGDVYRSLER